MKRPIVCLGSLPVALSVAIASPQTAPTATNDPSPSPTPAAANLEPTTVTQASWRPSDPIRIGQPGTYVDLGLVATFAAGGSTASTIADGTQSGGHDPGQNGFSVQGVELNIAGAVDPYFRGNVNLLFGVDADGEGLFELEEAWMESVSLPANLRIRAGQVYTEFGRHNPTHLHTWGFVDTPLANGRFLGGDGLRNPGAILSWLTPTPFYSELILGVQNSDGSTAASFRSEGHTHGGPQEEDSDLPLAYRHSDNDRGVVHASDLLFSPRYQVSFDLTDSQTLLLGASGAFGPNARGGEQAGDTTTQIYGADLTWKWKSLRHHGGFPFVQWQTEGMLRHYDAGRFDWDENGNGALDEGEVEDLDTGLPALLSGEVLTDYGLYTQILYGFRKGWVAGLRLDWLGGETADYEQRRLALDSATLGQDPRRDERWRLSPNLTWYPTEFSKLRLQYNYDDRRHIGIDHSVWLQFEFLLGAHAAHTF